MNNNAGSKTITGLNPITNIDCDELNVNYVITIDSNTPSSKKFLAYDPATATTKYENVDPATDLDINSLTELLVVENTDRLIVYDSSTGTNKKIAPENINPDITATPPLSITNNDIMFSYDGNDFEVTGNSLKLLYTTISSIPLGGNLNDLSITLTGTGTYTYNGSSGVSLTIPPNTDTTYTSGTGLTLSGTTFNFTGGDINGASISTTGGDISIFGGYILTQVLKIMDYEQNGFGSIEFQDSYGGIYITIRTPSYGSIPSAYSLTLPTSDGSNGQVLATDGGGVLSWTTPSSYVAGTGLSLNTNAFSFSGGNIGNATITSSGDFKCGKLTANEIEVEDSLYNNYPINPPGFQVASTQYRKLQIVPSQFIPNDDNSYYNLGLIDGNLATNTLYGFIKPMTSSLECYATITIPEGYKVVSFELYLRSTNTYTNVLRTCYAYKGNMTNAITRSNLIYMASQPYTNYEVQFTTQSTFTIEEYLILGISTGSSSDAIGGGWVKITKDT
jgi:hypothetical protein